MTFGERLKAARKNKNMTQKQLAIMIGAAHNSISNWENDQNKPDPDTIEILCGTLGISPNYLFYGTTEEIACPDNILPLPKTKKVPLLGNIACGEPILAEENISDFVDIPEYIHCDFTLRCKGDSMINARIFDGDIVCIRQQPTVENGEIAAVLIDNEATLKRIYITGDTVTLMPENTAYPPMVYVGEQIQNVRILGKAMHFISAVR